jgi:DNA polymerase
MRLYHKTYEEVTKQERNYAKPAVLGACYQLGAGEEIITDAGDRIKTGLLGYAAAMGIELSQEQAREAIQIYRTEYKEIVDFWYALERASIDAVRGKGPQTVGFVTFEAHGSKMLQVHLPSGRSLHYLQPEIEKKEFTSNGKTYEKSVLTYMGVDQQTRQWVRQHTRGGHLTENLCQAVARDILLSGLTRAEEAGLPVVAHVHDEIICEVPDDGSRNIQELVECMRYVPEWAPGLPLDAAGFSSKYYRKD